MAARVGVPLELAEELWHRLGFAHHDDADGAFTEADVQALSMARDLVALGILDADSQAALVRTWGRSFARLAEWQTELMARVAAQGDDPETALDTLSTEVLPRLEQLQSYIWRRHLVAAAPRSLALLTEHAAAASADPLTVLAVGFVDIVGYTAASRNLSEAELAAWIERFEDAATSVVTDHGARVIKTIGDEVLFVADDPLQAVEIALVLAARGDDDDDPFPQVRAGLAFGEVMVRLGDVLGTTVNVASRLTSVARPGAVVIDPGLHEVLKALTADAEEPDGDEPPEPPEAPTHRSRGLLGLSVAEELTDEAIARAREALSLLTGEETPTDLPYRFRRLRRVSVRGFPGMRVRVVRRTQ